MATKASSVSLETILLAEIIDAPSAGKVIATAGSTQDVGPRLITHLTILKI